MLAVRGGCGGVLTVSGGRQQAPTVSGGCGRALTTCGGRQWALTTSMDLQGALEARGGCLQALAASRVVRRRSRCFGVGGGHRRPVGVAGMRWQSVGVVDRKSVV